MASYINYLVNAQLICSQAGRLCVYAGNGKGIQNQGRVRPLSHLLTAALLAPSFNGRNNPEKIDSPVMVVRVRVRIRVRGQ